MHQPQYVDPRTRAGAAAVGAAARRARLPRRGARCSHEYGDVRLTVNFVPSLVAAARGGRRRARVDEWLRIARTRTRGTTTSAPSPSSASSRSTGIARCGRGRATPSSSAQARAARQRVLRRRRARSDGAVQPRLARLRGARRTTRELAALEHKGRGYSREDLALVVERQRARLRARAAALPRAGRARAGRALVVAVLPPDRAAARRQRARAARACPTATLPPPFAYPGDADAQIVRGADAARARLRRAGRAACGRPRARSRPRRSPLYARAGIGWLATDEGNLWRSLAHGAAQAARARRSLSRRGATPASTWSFAIARSATRSASPTRTATPHAGVADLLARARAAAALVDGAGRRAGAGAHLPRRREPVGVVPRLRRAVPAHALRARSSSRSRARRRRRSASTSTQAPARRELSRAALGLVDRLRLPHLDRRPDQEPRLGAARPRARAASTAPSPKARRRRSARPPTSTCSPPRAATGSGGSASRSTRWRTRSSTRSSARTSPAPTRRSACPRRASSTSRWPRTAPRRRRRRDARRAASSARTSAATASTTGRAPAAIACRAAPPWPTRRSSPPSSSASIATTLYLRLEPTDGRAAELAAARLEVDVAVGERRHVIAVARRPSVAAPSTASATAAAPTVAPSSWPCPSRALGAAPNDRLLLTLRLFAGGRAAGALPRRRRARAHRPRRRIRSRELVGVAPSALGRRRRLRERRAAPRAPRRRTAPCGATSRYFW